MYYLVELSECSFVNCIFQHFVEVILEFGIAKVRIKYQNRLGVNN